MAGKKDQTAPAQSAGQHLAGLLEVVARGRDRRAFEALFRYFAPRLKTYFLRRGATGGAESEEMVQETMLLVWQKAALFDPRKGAASTWIFTIARNVQTDGRRRSRSSETTVATVPEAMPWLDGTASGADEVVAAAQREAELHQALRTLPPEQMQALEMAYFGEHSQSEVSSRLGIPLGTVKARLRLALARLRTILNSGGHDDG